MNLPEPTVRVTRYEVSCVPPGNINAVAVFGEAAA